MGPTLGRALVIVLTGAVLGLAANAISPWRIPYIAPPKAKLQPQEMVSLQDAKQLWSSGAAIFLDARAPADYKAGHIANAFSLPIEEFDDYYPRVAVLLTTNANIVVYCDGQECDLSHHLALALRGLGYQHVHILVNGWTSWHTAGLPTHTGGQP
ncbi:MAG TPA: rhodanese-like domain-containing protein [Verrucomicrobiae bacterium]|nr:rhodanese-like domain-containing protein [Verrucomicrobiae bacterium]